MAEYEINLENLVKMKRVFEEADEDGSGELDPDEFYEKLGPYLGQKLSPAAVSQLFMRIDADCGGTIDWQEFINYFFLQRASAADAGNLEDWRLHAEDYWRKEYRGASHKEAVENIYCCDPLGQYITGGRGGVLRVWSAEGLAPVQTISNGNGWVTGCAFVECPTYKRLVVAAQDRTFTLYEPVRATFEYSSRLACPGTMGPPLCLTELQREAGGNGAPRLVWGDTEGAVMLLKADPPPLHTDRQLAPKRDFEVLHTGHTDWVTRLQHIPDTGLVSSSLDSTLRMLDLERGVLTHTVNVHKKGVRSFAYSPAFSLVASGGVERSVLLWQPKGNVNKPVGELTGHSSGVAQITVADAQSQVITLSDDHVVRLWDLRNHKCVQTITRADWHRPEDSKPTAMVYDTARRRLICASHKPVSWAHRRVEVERQHDARLVAALYNKTFSVVVSGDEGGTICMWNVQSGQREGGFSLHSQPASSGSSVAALRRGSGGAGAMLAPVAPPKLTAMTFDANQRRMLAALDKGLVRVYNFNSGAVLREFVCREGRQELTAVAFVPRQAWQSSSQLAEGAGPELGETCTDGAAEECAGGGQAAAAEHQQGEQQQSHPAADSSGSLLPGADYSDMSEHALLMRQQQDRQQRDWQQQQQQQQECSPGGGSGAPGLERHATPGSSTGSEGIGSSAAANLVLATGWGRSLCVWEEGEEVRSSRCRRMAGHGADVLCMAVLGQDIAATGDFDGEVRVWHLPSGTCLAGGSFGGAEFERAVRRLCWLPAGSGADSSSSPGVSSCTAESALLLVAGDNGSVQFWQVPLADVPRASTPPPASTPFPAGTAAVMPPAPPCRVLASMTATHRRQDCITCLQLDEPAEGSGCQLWMGDSSGHVALWDLSDVVAACHRQSPCLGGTEGSTAAAAAPVTPPLLAAAAQPRRLVHWRATGASVVSLGLLHAAGQGLVLVGGQDAAIGIWTRQGGLVGIFGKHTWEIEQPATWQDAAAAAVPQPLPTDDCETGLTPREIIANTPRRHNWVGSGATTARQQGASIGGPLTARGVGSPIVTARRPGTPGDGVPGWRPGTAGGALSQRPPGSAGSVGAGTGPPPTARSIVEEAHERQAQLVAKLNQLRLPVVAGEERERAERLCPSPRGLPVPVTTAVFRLPPEELMLEEFDEVSPALLAAARPDTCSSAASDTDGPAAAVRQFLSPESAGARLGALAAEAAASKADRWSLPVHVQAHSALALQHMEEVPADAASMWAQVKAKASEGNKERRARAGSLAVASPGGSSSARKRSVTPTHAVSIAAIMGSRATGLGRRVASPQQR